MQTLPLTTATQVTHAVLIKLQVNTSTYTISNAYGPLTWAGTTYLGMGNFLSMAEIQDELQPTTNQLQITLGGIPKDVGEQGLGLYNSYVSLILDQKIKGSKVEIYRAFFDPYTGEISQDQQVTPRTAQTVTAGGNASVNTSTVKFGTGSLSLDGTGDFLTASTSTNFGFGTEDFCIEMWVRRNTTAGTQVIADFRETVSATAPVFWFSGTNINFQYGSTATITTASGITTGGWYHIAAARSGGNTRIFVDGIQKGSTYADSNDYGSSQRCRIGARQSDGGVAFNGYMDEIRITKGIGRYTTNFTPPTAPFTNDNNTVLLLHCDGTAGSTTFTDDNTAYDIIGSTSLRFSGYISNFTISDATDIESKTDSYTISVACSSILGILDRKITGRRTNGTDQKALYPTDTGMDRVVAISNTAFDFGRPFTRGTGGGYDGGGGGGSFDEFFNQQQR